MPSARQTVAAAAVALVVLLLGRPAVAADAAKVDFAREVQPILSDNCFHCHGPDEPARKAKLRLDTKEGAYRVKDDVAVVVPGKPEASELVRRIVSDDPDEVMPPRDGIRKLTPKQISTLKRWVAEGAPWGTHWAFTPVVRPPVPKVDGGVWARNEIDAFVLDRLRREKLLPQPEADRERLIRRVSFDLTGLPPTPAETAAFVADPSPDAYEKVVDRLLASTRYGERMAAEWLDVARFADTHGYQMDRFRPMHPYRDWVIKAFNENLPYDQFATWQLAGDLLPNPTKDQRLATAFNRLHMQNEEGGIVEEEFRVAYVVDRVNTAGTAFMAMTFECARCHDHKFDPITQKDFYSLFSFFQNIDESGQTTYFTNAMPVPTMLLSTDEQDAKLRALRDRIAAKEAELVATRAAAGPAFNTWLGAKPHGTPTLPGQVAGYSFDAIERNQVENTEDPKKPGKAVDKPTVVPGKFGKAAELSGENGFTFPGVGHFTRADPCSLSIWLNPPAPSPRMVVVHHSKAPIDAGSRGYELLLEDNRVAFGLHHMWPGNSMKVVTKAALSADQWHHVAVSYDGSSRATGVRVYVDGRPQELDVVRDGLFKDITYEGGEPDLAVGYRFRDNGLKGGKVDEFRVFDRAITRLEAACLAGLDDLGFAWSGSAQLLTPAQRDGLLDYFLATAHEPSKALWAELHALRNEERKFVNPIPEAMVMKELPTPKPAFVLKRGNYDQPGEPVTAGTPKVLPPMSPDLPRNRLGFARWLFDPANPLTARVAANRLWQQMFGRGIVDSADNFGSTGSVPSHPELLDYLARAFADDMRWDQKRFLKFVAMSATYRQSSKASPELIARDPPNELLARGPARKLSAEMLRDQALAAGGLLVEKLGGPSVKPYQPPGLWEIAMGRPNYDQGHGESLYRRSLYTFVKRTVAPPSLLTFDAGDRSVCTVRRQSTSTPLQGLALLNDVQVVEAARKVAERVLRDGGADDTARIAYAFRLVTGRTATAKEAKVLTALLAEQREMFATEKDAAKKLLTVGESKPDAKLGAVEVASWCVLAQALFNHDEAVMRR